MKFGVVLDSTVYLDESFIKEKGIRVVSLNVIEGDKTYKELDITPEFVFERLDKGAKLTTSQPSPQEFLDAYQAFIDEGVDRVFVVCLSKGISGTYQSALLAQNMLEDKKDLVHVFDTESAAYGNELIAMELVRFIEDGLDEKEIVRKMNHVIERSGLFFTVENLFSLQKGGRLSKTQALLGTVLRVKPIIRMTEGKLKLAHKERTHKKVMDYVIKTFKEEEKKDAKLHVRLIERNSEGAADALVALIKEHYPSASVTVQKYLGPVFSIHVGPKGFGVTWYFE